MQQATINTLARHATQANQGTPTLIGQLELIAIKPPVTLNLLSYSTFVSFILSGKQTMTLGEQTFALKSGDVCFVPFEMPMIGQFMADNRPQFLAVSLLLDEQWLGEIIQEVQVGTHTAPQSGVVLGQMDGNIENCLERLIGLLDAPPQFAYLSELYKKELIVHLLNTPLKGSLLAFANQNSQLQKIKKVSDYLKQHWADKVSVAQLAILAQMGESSFYHYFKAITGFTPLQYQKAIRLNHAKKMIENKVFSISQIAYEVGYESVSQFSREYKRMFGVSPRMG